MNASERKIGMDNLDVRYETNKELKTGDVLVKQWYIPCSIDCIEQDEHNERWISQKDIFVVGVVEKDIKSACQKVEQVFFKCMEITNDPKEIMGELLNEFPKFYTITCYPNHVPSSDYIPLQQLSAAAIIEASSYFQQLRGVVQNDE